MKMCRKCKVEKELCEFYSRPSSVDGTDSYCKSCTKKYVTTYSSTPAAKLHKKEYDKQYRLRNAERRRELGKIRRSKGDYYWSYQKSWQSTLRGRFSAYRSRAKHNKMDFTLTMEQFVTLTSSLCVYCKKISQGREYVGIDRVDSSQGYTEQNCVPCCDICNYMKSDLSQEEFFEHISSIYKILIERKT
jgi:hypothetical protein